MADRGAANSNFLVVLVFLAVVIAIGWYFFAVALPGVPTAVKAAIGLVVVVALIFLSLK